MGFGGYLGLFIGASILSLYDISISFFMKLVTKFKSRGDSEIRTEELNAEIEKDDNDGQLEKVLGSKSFTSSNKVFSTPLRVLPVEIELEKSPIIIKMQENSVKQDKTLKKLEKLLAKHANILVKIEKRSKKYEDGYSYKKEVWK